MNWKMNLLRAAGVAGAVFSFFILFVMSAVDRAEQQQAAGLHGSPTGSPNDHPMSPPTGLPTAEARTRAPSTPPAPRAATLETVALGLQQLCTEIQELKAAPPAVAGPAEEDLQRVLVAVDDLKSRQQALFTKFAGIESTVARLAEPSERDKETHDQLTRLQDRLNALDSTTGSLSGKVEHLQDLATLAIAEILPTRSAPELRQSRVDSLTLDIRSAEAELQRRVAVVEAQRSCIEDPGPGHDPSKLAQGMPFLNRRVQQQSRHVDQLRVALAELEETSSLSQLRALLTQ